MIFNCLCSSLRSIFVAILQCIGIISQNNHPNDEIDDSTSEAVASQQDETHTAMPSSSHSKEPRLYEVFISFRGEDTRNKFASHLHSELVRRGIRTYIDSENLNHGQTLADELPKAIEESSIAIVVLSTHFGSSTWCLRELVKIMDCKINSGLDVFPIFYNVEPSDVRKQNNSFFQAFRKHEVNFKDDAQKVKSWRRALEEVADLVGEDTRGKNEVSCIKNIIDEISRKLPVKASQFRKSVVGIESRISEIKKMMYQKPNEVAFIGIWGMGGIGKTITARAIFEDCKNEFEGNCFLQDVRQINNELKKLQKKLLSDVLKMKFKIRDVVEGSSIIKERLQFKKVLLVIDDVDNIEQLRALAKECDWFGKGSVIIITTRDDQLLDDVYVKKYDVQTLPKNESLHLFCLHAFKNDHPPKDYKDLSLQVLTYTGRLPLALQVLGDHLYGRKICVWKSTLSRLKDVSEDKIISTLQVSFDGLNVIHQNMFLDIACFFRGSPKSKVEKQLQCLGLHPEEGFDVLIRRSLIYINFKKNEGDEFIEMHDLLQEMGWYIVRERANLDIRRYSRLWLQEHMIEVLSDITAFSEVEGICTRLDPVKFSYESPWEGVFGRMKKLSFLELQKMNNLSFLQLHGKYFEGNYDVNVPQSSAQFHNNKLRWFSLRHYSGQSLPKSFRPMNLVHLCLEGSKIEETPDFSHMPNLEELDLSWSMRLVRVHPSLGDHKKIKRVDMADCFDLEEFPKIKKMESLEILNLAKTKVKSLDLHPVVGNASKLRKLELTNSRILRTLDFSHLPYLEKLDLSGSWKLAEVHASLGVHKRIKSINLSKCRKLVEFPTIIDMNSLEELDLDETSLKCFPEMRGNVNRLVKLHLSDTKITTLPWSIARATGLEFISMSECKYLLTLPISLLGPKLKEVIIKRGVLKSFTDETGQAAELHSRQRKRRKQLIVSQGMGQLSDLDIKFYFCDSLEELPEPLLARIVSLTIRNCPSLTTWICYNLVDLLDNYQHLRNLQLHHQSDTEHDFLQAFSEWESVSNMMRKRQNSFKIYVPGNQSPSWFQYRINLRRATAVLPPSDEWDSDNLNGFVLSGINAKLVDESLLFPDFNAHYGYNCWPQCHVLIIYVPVKNIRNWEGQIERTLFQLERRYDRGEELSSWGLSLVYNEEIVNPREVRIAINDDYDDMPHFYEKDNPLRYSHFRVKIAQSKVSING